MTQSPLNDPNARYWDDLVEDFDFSDREKEGDRAVNGVSRWRDSGHLERAVETAGGQAAFDAAVTAMLDVHGSRYQRPYAVPERLDLLRGPSAGTIHLPSHLDWSGNAVYGLDAPGRVVDLYRAVLIEAASPQDLYAYLDEKVLRRLWALLWLPSQLRTAWEQRFPVLAEIRRPGATA
jgi:hypothetical protein